MWISILGSLLIQITDTEEQLYYFQYVLTSSGQISFSCWTIKVNSTNAMQAEMKSLYRSYLGPLRSYFSCQEVNCKNELWDFCGGLVARTCASKSRGYEFDSWEGKL